MPHEQGANLAQLAYDGLEAVHARCNDIEKDARRALEAMHKLEIEIVVVKTKIALFGALFGLGGGVLVEVLSELVKSHLK